MGQITLHIFDRKSCTSCLLRPIPALRDYGANLSTVCAGFPVCQAMLSACIFVIVISRESYSSPALRVGLLKFGRLMSSYKCPWSVRGKARVHMGLRLQSQLLPLRLLVCVLYPRQVGVMCVQASAQLMFHKEKEELFLRKVSIK